MKRQNKFASLQNAFNQLDNQKYYYRKSDILTIYKESTYRGLGDVIIHEPIVNRKGSAVPVLRALTEWLDTTPVVCIYSSDIKSWGVFAAFKNEERFTILYKNSKGTSDKLLEGQIKNLRDNVDFIVHRGTEQSSAADSGICALENIQIMAEKIGHNREGFVKQFEEVSDFCTPQRAKQLRTAEFAKQYVLGAYKNFTGDAIGKPSPTMENFLEKLAILSEDHRAKEFVKLILKKITQDSFYALTLSLPMVIVDIIQDYYLPNELGTIDSGDKPKYVLPKTHQWEPSFPPYYLLKKEDLVSAEPLHKMIEAEATTEQIRQFLDQNPTLNINAPNSRGYTPIQKLYHGPKQNLGALKLLLLKGADVNMQDQRGDTLAHYAAEDDDYNLLVVLRRAKANFNTKNRAEKTPLQVCNDHYAQNSKAYKFLFKLTAIPDSEKLVEAIKAERIEHVKEVLSQLNPDDLNRETKDELIFNIACGVGNLKIIELLKKAGCKSNLTDDRGRTALHEACYADNISRYNDKSRKEVIKFLLKEGLNINTRDDSGSTALSEAVWSANLEVIELLLRNNANPDLGDVVPPLLAIINLPRVSPENLEVIKLLLYYKADILKTDGHVGNSLHLAAERGHLGAAKVLVEHAQKINKLKELFSPSPKECRVCAGLTPADIAGKYEKTELEKFLVREERDSNISEIFKLAATGKASDLVKLIEGEKEVIKVQDQRGWTILHHAVFKNNEGVIKLLLRIDDKTLSIIADNRGYTPAHIAISRGYVDAVKTLVDNNPELLKIRNDMGWTLLYYATLNNNQEIVEYLLVKRADPNSADITGTPPLHIAASLGNQGIIKSLSEYRAEMNAVDVNERNALHSACSGINDGSGADFVTIKLLLSLGTKYASDKEGIFPADEFNQDYGHYRSRLEEIRTDGKSNRDDSMLEKPIQESEEELEVSGDSYEVEIIS